MENILITGGAGFIGSNLAKLLIAKNHNIFIIDDLSTGSINNIPEGSIFFEGKPTDAVNDNKIKKFYLGTNFSI